VGHARGRVACQSRRTWLSLVHQPGRRGRGRAAQARQISALTPGGSAGSPGYDVAGRGNVGAALVFITAAPRQQGYLGSAYEAVATTTSVELPSRHVKVYLPGLRPSGVTRGGLSARPSNPG
jgi:hypothetical protein